METRDTIYLNARELEDESARAAYLAQACGPDAALRAQVEGMLRQAAEAEDFFEGPGISSGFRPLIEGPGTVIGRYKLLEKIGEGGMGVVYMAEQREPVSRKVALKIIKLGMDTRQVVARFEAERQALALMDHPNIARVLDGGATEAGRPYFVMDLVQGLPITEFCDQAGYSTQERLALFLEVCAAIGHAHQKGIIHRDIKPSNILVTLHGDKPVPKIIDFGIAKATQQRLTEKTLFTRFQQFVGTPAYTSPEQASLSGLDVDTRSDIYGLGVLLYELLTGTTPFDSRELLQAGLDEMRRTIQEREPARPSARLSTLQGEDLAQAARRRAAEPPGLIHLVRGDLDWIVMKCLEKDRARRYDTASGLAADLKRYLGNEPIEARPPATIYRVRKWVRRNRIPFAAISAVSLSLLLAAVISTWQARLALQAQRDLQEQTETARAVKDFLLREVLGGVEPFDKPLGDEHRRAVVERAAVELEGKFTHQPLVEAEIRYALGEAFDVRDDFTKAAVQYERAHALRKASLGASHSETLAAAAAVGWQWINLGRRREGEQWLADAVAAARSAPDYPTYGAGEVLWAHGYRLLDAHPDEALPFLQESLEIFHRTSSNRPFNALRAEFGIATAHHFLGNSAMADEKFRAGIQRAEQVHGPNHPMLAAFFKGYALFLIQDHRLDEALGMLDSALAIQRKMLGPDNSYTLESEGFVAQALEQKGDVEGAAAIYRSLYPQLASLAPYDRAVSKLENIANFFVRHHRYPDAREVFFHLRKALPLMPTAPGEFHHLLRAIVAVDGWSAGASFCKTGMELFPDSLWIWLNKAWVFRAAGDEESYRQVVQKVLALPAVAKPSNDQHLPFEIASLGSDGLSAAPPGQLDALARSLEGSLPARDRQDQRWAWRALAAWRFRQGRWSEGMDFLEKSIAAQTPAPDPYTLYLKAIGLQHLGRSEEARAALREADAHPTAIEAALPEAENFLAPAGMFQLVVARREAYAEVGAP